MHLNVRFFENKFIFSLILINMKERNSKWHEYLTWPVRYLPVELRILGLFHMMIESRFPAIPMKQMIGATTASMMKLSSSGRVAFWVT